MKQTLLIFLCSVIFGSSYAQNPDCKVLLDSIKGSYSGDCKNGKADGTGTAIGTDTYAGEFKNGLPEGKGKYTWANGDYYYGGWKKGLKEGKGELHLPVNGEDSAIFGYWRKGVYSGQYESAFKILNNSSDIGRVEVNKIRGGKTSITVSVENLIGGGRLMQGSLQTTTRMTDIKVTRGSYNSKNSNALTNKEITTFTGVIFPFRVWMYFGTSHVEIEFYESSDWDVRIPINK
jgi:hypothetical protein